MVPSLASSARRSLGGTDDRVLRSVVIGGAGTKTTTGGANTTEEIGTETKKLDRFASLTIPNVEMFNRMRGVIFSF